MQSFPFQFVSKDRCLRVRSVARLLTFVFVGVVACTGKSHAQQNAYTPSNFPNVEERHVPGGSVWPKTTRAVGAGGRIAPTIVRDNNGVKAVLNPSWFTTAKRQTSPSGKVGIICDDGTKTHSHVAHIKRAANKTRAASAQKSGRKTR